ncbi:hypothetical protein POM88_030282 [Heracleum sosnowskyi]|uniref:Uncharacterized protein n=1 Tax=Heracleum sosnowskyi TaxID=360622 RepID=A0AAD8MIJ4_9APIA|nr:hypothetical protein POM88_030282 [Heracleum sosnowskyi]
MFAKKLFVSFTVIVVVFTSDLAYNHAEELPKLPFFDTPGSSDISDLSLDGTYATTKSPWDPWYSGLPFHSIREFSSSQAQQPPSEAEDPVFKPAVLGLNGWGRVPRYPKFGHGGTSHFRFPPRRPRVPPPKVWSRAPPPPVRTSPPPPAWSPPPPPVTVQPPSPTPTPTIQPPSPTPMEGPSPYEAPTPVEPPSLNPAKPPSPASDSPAITPDWENHPSESPTLMW